MKNCKTILEVSLQTNPWESGKGKDVGNISASIDELVCMFGTPVMYENQSVFLYIYDIEFGMYCLEAEDNTDYDSDTNKKEAVLDLFGENKITFTVWIDKESNKTERAIKNFFEEKLAGLNYEFWSHL